jgi:hypothetical protein
VEPVTPSPVTIPGRSRRTQIFAALTLLLAIACLSLVVWNIQLRRTLAGPDRPALQQLWSRLSSPQRATDIVLADSNLSLLQDLLQKPVSPNAYLHSQYLDGDPEALLGRTGRRTIDLLMSRRYTSMAEVQTLRRLLLTNRYGLPEFNIYFARDFSAENLKTSNVVLVGSKRSNPWVQLFEEDLNFRFDHDEKTGFATIFNKHPRPDEQQFYTTQAGSPTLVSYGVVAFVPNLSASGNILIIAGAGMHATEAAGEFITNEQYFAPFVSDIGIAAGKPLPYFEVLLETTVMGATMKAPRVLSWRVKPQSQASR